MPKKTKKQNAEKRTYVMLVIDRSGSMQGMTEAVVKGMNEQLKTLRENASKGGKTEVSILQFDNQFDIVVADKEPDQINDWTAADFIPRGGTALRDALYRGIAHLKSRPTTEDTGFLISVISDGEENSSTEVTEQMLKDEIAALEKTNKWTFSYLMSNIKDRSAFQTSFSVNANNVAYYNSTPTGMAATNNVASAALGSFMTTRGGGGTYTANVFTEDQKTKLLDTK